MSKAEARTLLQPPLSRVVIENIQPQIDSGRFPIKRTVGEDVVVTADVHADGHDVVRAALWYRREAETEWSGVEMRSLGNDRWEGKFTVREMEPYVYTVQGWTDAFRSWRRDFLKKKEAGQDLSVDVLSGVQLMAKAAARGGNDAPRLKALAEELRALAKRDLDAAVTRVLDEEILLLMNRNSDRRAAVTHAPALRVTVDRERARFSAWYEMFPRSCAPEPGRHGTLKDCTQRLDYVASMGFNVVYLPPIHPIGTTNRKGKNNSPQCEPGDVGSPWAIGGKEGGHKAIHPQLGTLADFHRLVARAKELGMEVAMDLAYQCTPDHPYAREHKEWFRIRPDGSVQYAENPPKKYQDIYPIYFESDAVGELGEELKSIVLYWIEQGVRIFRVDNPHTKPYAFWEWMIAEVRREHPDVLFLSEAFTRPKVMYRLAKLGFTQSYTYFAWRNTKWELEQYFTELTTAEVREFLRPNLWPNTPDILTEFLQFGGRPAFALRLVLAATLGASYGIYGPAFELGENHALKPGSEEYLDSEKYQVRHWETDSPDSLSKFIARVNKIRNENPALHSDRRLQFVPVDNEQIIAYAKSTADLSSIILVVVNLDPHHTHSGFLEFPMEHFQIDRQQPFQVHDLLTDARFLWRGSRNYIELNPAQSPAQIFRIRRRVRTERDFDYYL